MASSIRKEFDVAFRSALDAGESTFEFQGKKYNTKMAPPKTESNRGGARMKSGKDIMDTLPKVGKVNISELPPKGSTFIPGNFDTPMAKLPGKSPTAEQYRKAQEDYQSDLVGKMAMKKGGMVTTNRGVGKGSELLDPNNSDTPTVEQQEEMEESGKALYEKLYNRDKQGSDNSKGYRKGGIVTAKRSSKRGCGIAVKGFGRAGGR